MFGDEQVRDPYELFAAWLKEAEASEPNDANAMALATVDEQGMPAQRMVLLKGVDSRGFVFYTNYNSRKGQHLLNHPKAALLFHWKSLRRQVRVEGVVEQVTAEEADAYYASRARQSQIGAWASDQSQSLESRFALEKQVAKIAAKYPIGDIPRPSHWSGFRILPSYFEFWKDGAFRLHDRLVYKADGNAWETDRLYP